VQFIIGRLTADDMKEGSQSGIGRQLVLCVGKRGADGVYTHRPSAI